MKEKRRMREKIQRKKQKLHGKKGDEKKQTKYDMNG